MINQEFINEEVVEEGFRAETLGKLAHTREVTIIKNPIVLKEAGEGRDEPLVGFQIIERQVETMKGTVVSQVYATSDQVEELSLGLPMANLIQARLVGSVIKVDSRE